MSKPPEPELSTWQRFHKSGRGLAKVASELAISRAQQSFEVLRDADEKFAISEGLKGVGADVNRRFHVSEKADAVRKSVSAGARVAASAAKRIADEQGVTTFVTDNVVEPIRRSIDSVVSSGAARNVFSAGEGFYGATRRIFVGVFAPYLPTYDSYELLQATKSELNYVAACILQVSPEESSQLGMQFSRAVTAKVVGTASTTALLALVAAFGHAGTGTAITGLSGAAATTATFAWVGSLVGGGVAAGAALTGGLALGIGLATYKILASDRRAFESLSELEQRIVQSCWMLAAVADAYQKQPREFAPEAAGEFLDTMLIPLHQDIAANMDVLCRPLDSKNAVAMRQHVMADFQLAVIDRFGRYLNWAHSEGGRAWHASLVANVGVKPRPDTSTSDDPNDVTAVLRPGQVETAIGGVFAALLSREALDGSTESRLVLDSLRRSRLDLHDASQAQLGDYLRLQAPEELRGAAANVKGIYHELWYVEQYNATHETTYARPFEATNHRGSDVEIVDADTGQIVREVQLKAVESRAAVDKHFERDPHIDVVVTDEVASRVDDARVAASGIANSKLEGAVGSRIDDLREHTVSARTGDTALIALGIASAAELMQMLRGERQFPEAVMNTAAKVGTAAGATALTALLFG
jgi:hypothetical protein